MPKTAAVLVRLSTALNPIITAVLRSPFHWVLSRGVMLITVTGRTSGRRYTIPVGYHHAADAIIVMVGEAPSKVWWRNYRDSGPIEVHLRGEHLRGRAQVLAADSAEFRTRADASFRRSRVLPWIFGIVYDRRTGLSDAQVKQLARDVAIVRITVGDNDSAASP